MPLNLMKPTTCNWRHPAARRRVSCFGGVALAALAAVGIVKPARADAELTAMLPESTIACYSWAGAEALSQGFAESVFGMLCAEPQIAKFGSVMLRESDEWFKRTAVNDSGPLKYLATPVRELAQHAWKRPWTLALLELSGDPGSPFEAVLIMDGGAAAGSLKLLADQVSATLVRGRLEVKPQEDARLSGWQAVSDPTWPGPVSWGFAGNRLIVTMGARAPKIMADTLAGGRSLADSADYQAVRQTMAEPDDRPGTGADALCLYVSVARLLARIDYATLGDRDTPLLLGHLLRSSGVLDVSALGASARNTPSGPRHVLYLKTNQSPRGMFEPAGHMLQNTLLTAVPRDSRFVYSMRHRLGVFAMGWLGSIESLEAVLGNGWVMYHAPSEGWLTVCIRVDDGDRAKRALRRIVEEMMPGVRFKTTRYKTGEVLFVDGEGPLALAAGDVNGWLVIAPFPQTVSDVMSRLASPDARDHSILTRPEFADSLAGPGLEMGAIIWQDTPALVRGLHPYAMVYGHTAMRRLKAMGMNVDTALIPSAASIARHVSPASATTEIRDDGILMISRTSAPLLAPSIPEAVVLSPLIALIASQLVPQEPAVDRSEGADKLRRMGRACMMYANAHDGALPGEVTALKDYVSATEFGWLTMGLVDSRRPRACTLIEGLPPLARISDPSALIVMYENPAIYGGNGTNVLYADGSVNWRARHQFEAELESTLAAIGAGAKDETSP